MGIVIDTETGKRFPRKEGRKEVRWYEITAVGEDSIGFSFETPEGEKIRLILSLDNAIIFSDTLLASFHDAMKTAEYATLLQKMNETLTYKLPFF